MQIVSASVGEATAVWRAFFIFLLFRSARPSVYLPRHCWPNSTAHLVRYLVRSSVFLKDKKFL